MKKLIVFMAIAFMALSCSDDDTTPVQQDGSFFNLANGNYWIYKRYLVNYNTSVEVPMGLDSVRISGQQIIDGIPYFKMEHWIPANGLTEATLEDTDYIRINDEDHLVRSDGRVIHPGYDSTFQYTGPASAGTYNYGSLDFSVGNVVSINVEGNDYSAVPYSGYYTPPAIGGGGPEGIGAVYFYQPGIGEILQKCRFIGSADEYLEKRLVSYHLN